MEDSMREQGAGFGGMADAGRVESDHPCVVCGYNLRGIARSGACPECGSEVARSFRGDELIYSSPDYVASLHRGVFIVLAAIIAMILLMFGGVGLAVAGAAAGFHVRGLEITLTATMTGVGFVTAYGWWLLSAPDPASRDGRKGETARKIVRITVIVNVVVSCVSLLTTFLLPPAAPLFPAPGAPNTPVTPPPGAAAAMLIGAAMMIVSLITSAVAYFAQMFYIRWLAPRLPSAKVFDRAKLLMWLGPLLYVVGSFCVGIGPLVALVLYWNMLDEVRKHLKRIRGQMAASTAPLMAS